MKSLMLGAAIASGLITCSYAADLPVKAPPQVQTDYGYNWTGFYVGGHLGGAWTNTVDRTTYNNATGAVDGSVVNNYSNDKSFMGGGQLGYNWMFAPHGMLGIEGDFSGVKLDPSVINTNVVGNSTHIVGHDEKVDWFGTLRGRLGYAWNNWLIYGTGGVAWDHLTGTRTQIAGTTNGTATPGTIESGTTTKTGYALGAGVEWGFAPHWSLRGEYLFLGFSGTSYVFPIANRTDVWSGLNINVARAALNYRF